LVFVYEPAGVLHRWFRLVLIILHNQFDPTAMYAAFFVHAIEVRHGPLDQLPA
jgi:hypothetical protein